MATIAIIDFAHSGTTMISGIYEILGVPMVGDSYTEAKWEDLDVINNLGVDEEAFRDIVEQRNSKHEVWGFKRPGAWIWMDIMQKYLRDPLYIAIYKDPVSVTNRRFAGNRRRHIRKVRNTIRQMQASIDGIYRCQVPVHIFSYKTCILTPYMFVKSLSDIAKLNSSVEQMKLAASYIEPNKFEVARKHYPKVNEWI